MQSRRTHRSACLGAAQEGEVGPVVGPSPERPPHSCAHGQQPDDDLAGVQGPRGGLPDGGILAGLSRGRFVSQKCVGALQGLACCVCGPLLRLVGAACSAVLAFDRTDPPQLQ